jgi:prolyl oligopeptidase
VNTSKDPFAWLEEDSERTCAWEQAQDKAAQAALHSAPYAELVDDLTQILAENIVSAPIRRGTHWFRIRFAGEERWLEMAASATGRGRPIVQPSSLGSADKPCTLDWFFPSPGGRYVAFGLSFGGDEQSVLNVLDIDGNELLPERIPFTSMATVAWLPDESGFFYNASRSADWIDADKQIVFHRLGDTEDRPAEPLSVREAYTFPQVSPDGRWVAAITSEVTPRADYIKRLPDGAWEPFLVDVRGAAFGVFGDDDNYIAIVTEDAPRGRVVSIPLSSPTNRSSWVDLVPESDAVLRTIDRIGPDYVLVALDDCYHRISLVDPKAKRIQDVPLPGRGVAMQEAQQGTAQSAAPWRGRSLSPGQEEFTFVFAAPGTSPALYLYDLQARRLEMLTPSRYVHDWVTVDAETTAPDGSAVRYRLVHRKDLSTLEPRPALINAYGGWNVSFLPGYCGTFGPFIDAGGILVLAHLRGGGEFGELHWHDGRLARKQNTFDDLYAVADALISSRLTGADRLAVCGASNGGLTTGVAVTQRPHLWRAVCSMVPFCDLVKFKRDAYTETFKEEYGDPDDPEQLRWLLSYSPYHNVRDGERYPATLIYCGANDMRCPPWHARKFAAALQAANHDREPILLRIRPRSGHLEVKSDPTQVAEWLGFLMRELGLVPRRDRGEGTR